MSRLIFIIVIVALVYWLFKSYARKLNKQDQEQPPKTQDMVSCAHCGINLPKSESVSVDGKYYCCTAHSRGQSEK